MIGSAGRCRRVLVSGWTLRRRSPVVSGVCLPRRWGRSGPRSCWRWRRRFLGMWLRRGGGGAGTPRVPVGTIDPPRAAGKARKPLRVPRARAVFPTLRAGGERPAPPLTGGPAPRARRRGAPGGEVVVNRTTETGDVPQIDGQSAHETVPGFKLWCWNALRVWPCPGGSRRTPGGVVFLTKPQAFVNFLTQLGGQL